MAKSSKVGKFFRDYPILLLIAGIFVLGFGLGYFLNSKKVERKTEIHSSKPAILKEVAIASPVLAPTVSVPPAATSNMLSNPVVEEMMAITEQMVQPKATAKGPWKPKIAFVIDDVGYNKRWNEILFSMDRPITIAILPELPYSRYFAEEGKNHHLETILHLPLEPDHGRNPGPGTIMVDMSLYEIRSILNKDLASVPGVVGVNNHMGSRATRDRALMYLILKDLKRRKLFFLDSMTHPDSIAHQVAFAVGIPSFQRNVFLDNVDNFNRIMDQIDQTSQVAKQLGKAVAIGHYRKNTLEAIKKAIPKLEAKGFEISTLQAFTEKNVYDRN